jgi:hypothetical protein
MYVCGGGCMLKGYGEGVLDGHQCSDECVTPMSALSVSPLQLHQHHSSPFTFFFSPFRLPTARRALPQVPSIAPLSSSPWSDEDTDAVDRRAGSSRTVDPSRLLFLSMSPHDQPHSSPPSTPSPIQASSHHSSLQSCNLPARRA